MVSEHVFPGCVTKKKQMVKIWHALRRISNTADTRGNTDILECRQYLRVHHMGKLERLQVLCRVVSSAIVIWGSLGWTWTD